MKLTSELLILKDAISLSRSWSKSEISVWVMLVTRNLMTGWRWQNRGFNCHRRQWCWWLKVGSISGCWWQNLPYSCHNNYRLQHPSPTSVTNINVILSSFYVTKILHWKRFDWEIRWPKYILVFCPSDQIFFYSDQVY